MQQTKQIKIYTTAVCPFCIQAKRLFQQLNLNYEEINLEGKTEERMRISQENGGWRTVPMIFVGEKFVGGYTDFEKLYKDGTLESLLV